LKKGKERMKTSIDESYEAFKAAEDMPFYNILAGHMRYVQGSA